MSSSSSTDENPIKPVMGSITVTDEDDESSSSSDEEVLGDKRVIEPNVKFMRKRAEAVAREDLKHAPTILIPTVPDRSAEVSKQPPEPEVIEPTPIDRSRQAENIGIRKVPMAESVADLDEFDDLDLVPPKPHKPLEPIPIAKPTKTHAPVVHHAKHASKPVDDSIIEIPNIKGMMALPARELLKKKGLGMTMLVPGEALPLLHTSIRDRVVVRAINTAPGTATDDNRDAWVIFDVLYIPDKFRMDDTVTPSQKVNIEQAEYVRKNYDQVRAENLKNTTLKPPTKAAFLPNPVDPVEELKKRHDRLVQTELATSAAITKLEEQNEKRTKELEALVAQMRAFGAAADVQRFVDSATKQRVEIPNLIGLTAREARRRLEGLKTGGLYVSDAIFGAVQPERAKHMVVVRALPLEPGSDDDKDRDRWIIISIPRLPDGVTMSNTMSKEQEEMLKKASYVHQHYLEIRNKNLAARPPAPVIESPQEKQARELAESNKALNELTEAQQKVVANLESQLGERDREIRELRALVASRTVRPARPVSPTLGVPAPVVPAGTPAAAEEDEDAEIAPAEKEDEHDDANAASPLVKRIAVAILSYPTSARLGEYMRIPQSGGMDLLESDPDRVAKFRDLISANGDRKPEVDAKAVSRAKTVNEYFTEILQRVVDKRQGDNRPLTDDEKLNLQAALIRVYDQNKEKFTKFVQAKGNKGDPSAFGGLGDVVISFKGLKIPQGADKTLREKDASLLVDLVSSAGIKTESTGSAPAPMRSNSHVEALASCNRCKKQVSVKEITASGCAACVRKDAEKVPQELSNALKDIVEHARMGDKEIAVRKSQEVVNMVNDSLAVQMNAADGKNAIERIMTSLITEIPPGPYQQTIYDNLLTARKNLTSYE